MLTTVKEQLFTNWHPMRWMALIFGTILLYNWIGHNAPVSGFLALFFLYQAITNTGCLAGQCAAPVYDDKNGNQSVTEFEEIREDK